MEDQALCWWAVARLCWKDRDSICGVQTVFEVGQFNGDKAEMKTSPRMRTGGSTDRQDDSRRSWRIHKKTRNEWEQTQLAFVSLFEYQHRQPGRRLRLRNEDVVGRKRVSERLGRRGGGIGVA